MVFGRVRARDDVPVLARMRVQGKLPMLESMDGVEKTEIDSSANPTGTDGRTIHADLHRSEKCGRL